MLAQTDTVLTGALQAQHAALLQAHTAVQDAVQSAAHAPGVPRLVASAARRVAPLVAAVAPPAAVAQAFTELAQDEELRRAEAEALRAAPVRSLWGSELGGGSGDAPPTSTSVPSVDDGSGSDLDSPTFSEGEQNDADGSTEEAEAPYVPSPPVHVAPLTPLAGSAARRVVSRLQRCGVGELVATEMGLMALSALLRGAELGELDELDDVQLRLQALRFALEALRAQGAAHSALALAAADCITRLLRCSRSAGPADSDTALALAVREEAASSLCDSCSAHPADAAVQAALLSALLALHSPGEGGEGAIASAQALRESVAAKLAADALWAHPADARTQASACRLMAALGSSAAPQLLSQGAAVALLAALRKFCGAEGAASEENSEAAEAAATALWRLAVSGEPDALRAIRYAGAPEVLSALLEGGGAKLRPPTRDAVRGCLDALDAPPIATMRVSMPVPAVRMASDPGRAAGTLMAEMRTGAAAPGIARQSSSPAFEKARLAQEAAAQALQAQMERSGAMLAAGHGP